MAAQNEQTLTHSDPIQTLYYLDNAYIFKFIYLLIYVRFKLFEITKDKVYTVYTAFLCLLNYAFCY